MNTIHLFAGAGGGLIADMLLGHTPVGAVEINKYCRRVLYQRQQDGWLPKFPIFRDVRNFNGTEIRKKVDCLCGGFPCQDISTAGRGEGIHGKRSGLFFELPRIVDKIRPEFVFLENVPAITTRGIDAVLGEMVRLRYDCRWCVLSAAEMGAPHIRKRWWCLCRNTDLYTVRSIGTFCSRKKTDRNGIRKTISTMWNVSDADRKRCEEQLSTVTAMQTYTTIECCSPYTPKYTDTEFIRTLWRNWQYENDRKNGRLQNGETIEEIGQWWSTEPGMGRVADGVAHRVDRLKALGNGQVPAVAATAFLLLLQQYKKKKEL